jgi:hypothetical protein
MRTILWLAGGISVGLGMVSLTAYGFDQPNGEVSANFSQYGFDALPMLTIAPAGYTGFLMVVLGAVLMIRANATAWKQTDGY